MFSLLITVTLIPLSLFHAWVAQKLYGWFVLPLGAPQLNLWEVWGLALLINHLTVSNRTTTKKNKPVKQQVLIVAGTIIGTLVALLLGLIIKSHIQVG